MENEEIPGGCPGESPPKNEERVDEKTGKINQVDIYIQLIF